MQASVPGRGSSWPRSGHIRAEGTLTSVSLGCPVVNYNSWGRRMRNVPGDGCWPLASRNLNVTHDLCHYQRVLCKSGDSRAHSPGMVGEESEMWAWFEDP